MYKKITNIFNNKVNNEILKKSFHTLFFRVFGFFFSYLFTFLIIQFYNSKVLGIYTLSITILNISLMISLLGFDNLFLRLITKFSSKQEFTRIYNLYFKGFIITSCVALFIFLLLFYYSDYISHNIFSKEEMLLPIKIISFFILPLSILSLLSAIFRSNKNIIFYSFFKFLSIPFLSCIFIISYNFYDFDIIAPLISYGTSILLSLGLAFYLFAKYHFFPLLRNRDKKNAVKNNTIKSLLGQSLPFLIASSMLFLLKWSDSLMLGHYRSLEEVGVYSLTFKISSLIGIILIAVNSIAAPKFSDFYSLNQMNKFKEIINFSSKLIFWLALPLFLLIIFLSGLLLNFFGQEYMIGKNTLIILCFSQFYNTMCGSVGYILMMTDNQTIYTKIIFLSFTLNIILNIFLIPAYGILGAAFSSLISMILWNTISVYIVNKKFNIFTMYIPFLKNNN